MGRANYSTVKRKSLIQTNSEILRQSITNVVSQIKVENLDKITGQLRSIR